VRTLSWRLAPTDEGAGGNGGDARWSARAFPAEGAMARLPHLLRRRVRRWLDRAEEVCRASRGDRLQEVSDRGGSLHIPLLHPRPRIGGRGIRGILAQGPRYQAAGIQSDPR